MNYKLVTEATEEAVSLDEFKGHTKLEIGESLEDATLATQLLAAREYVEDETGRKLITSTWDLFLPYFPNAAEIQIPFGQLQSVTYIKYFDVANVEHTVNPATYRVVTEEEPGRVVLAYQQIWPVEILRPGPAVTVRFVCGWASAALVPARIKQAIELLAAYYYRNREAAVIGRGDVSVEIALGMDRLLRGQRLWRF